VPNVSNMQTQSNKPAAPPNELPLTLSREERIAILRERVKVLRDGATFDRGRVSKPDPDIQYMWVNAREERQIYFQALGWEICRDSGVGTKYWKPDENQHRRADLILYMMPKELFYAHEAYKMLRGLDLTGEAADAAFASEIGREGVKMFKPVV
jgi:hypothetical protein